MADLVIRHILSVNRWVSGHLQEVDLRLEPLDSCRRNTFLCTGGPDGADVCKVSQLDLL